jgi:ATP-dependent Lon protease
VTKKIALTGEITLKGKVLSVGGIKEKLLAAHRHNIREAIIPFDNKPDMKDLPKKIKDEIKVHFVENMDQVLDIVLTEKFSDKIKKDKEEGVTTELPKSKEEGEGQEGPPVTH